MSGRQGHLVIIRMFPIRLIARTGQHRDGIDRPKPLRGTVEGCRGACNPKSRRDDKDGSVSIMHAWAAATLPAPYEMKNRAQL